MNMLLEAPVAVDRIGDSHEQAEALKASAVKGELHGAALTELRLQCDRELRELQAEFDTLLNELKMALQRMQAGRRLVRRSA